MFFLDIHLLYLFYIFQCHIRHHQEEPLCHFLTTRYCYEAINYGFSSSYVVNYKSVTVPVTAVAQWLRCCATNQ